MLVSVVAGGRMQGAHQQQQRWPTLLQKLLAPDIRAEHSRLLQCLRFLVTNNFLLDYGCAPLVFPPQPAAPASTLQGTGPTAVATAAAAWMLCQRSDQVSTGPCSCQIVNLQYNITIYT